MPTTIDRLIATPRLDQTITSDPAMIREFEQDLDRALGEAYQDTGDSRAHLFLQRTLYRINRLSFFWYDGLDRYENERSRYLADVRDRIEDAWQTWELAQLPLDRIRGTDDVPAALRARAAADLDPEPTDLNRFYAAMNEAGYRQLLKVLSLDGVVEASQMSRTLGGVTNQVHMFLTKLLLEEYGGGRIKNKHSSYFTAMLDHFGMDTTPEAYFSVVPWEVLANINLSFLLSERKRHYLRYMGGLLYIETSVPAAFTHYEAAARALGIPPVAYAYWTIHIKADAVHGRWMLDEIALPLVELYPNDAWELVWGYDHQVFASDRAARAIAESVQQAQGGPAIRADVPAVAARG